MAFIKSRISLKIYKNITMNIIKSIQQQNILEPNLENNLSLMKINLRIVLIQQIILKGIIRFQMKIIGRKNKFRNLRNLQIKNLYHQQKIPKIN